MGGDRAPQVVVRGAELARERHPGVRFLMFGDEAKVEPLLGRYGDLAAVTTLRHTKDAILSEDKPSAALRGGRESSMWLAIDAVHNGEASAVISAGNTGALMAMAKVVLRTLPGIDRPAIAGIFPTRRGETVMLDLGANIECGADNLVDFALMGAFLARAVLGVVRPTVGLLNVGEEELKGHEEIRQAGAILRGADLHDCDLRGADLRDADLSGVDLSGADLVNADLSGANLSDVDLGSGDLRGAETCYAIARDGTVARTACQ